MRFLTEPAPTAIKIIFILSLFFLSTNSHLMAYDEGEGGEAPDSDVSQPVESDPLAALDIKTVKFDLIDGKPEVDGVIDDHFWAQAKHFDLDYELYPTRLDPAPIKTEALVGATEDYLYVAFVAHDPNIKDLRSAPRERDGTKEDDYVSIIIDPTGKGAKKYEFRVNPHGSLSDVLQNTINDRYIYDWDTDWSGEAQITENGFTVEIEIPVDSVRQPEIEPGEKNLGIMILKRSYPRRVDRVLATFFLVDRSSEDPPEPAAQATQTESKPAPAEKTVIATSDEKTTDGDDVAKEEVITEKAPAEQDAKEDQKSLEFTPYYIYHFDEERSIGGTFEQIEDHNEHEVGFDLKYQIDSSSSVSLTYNPNFTEVESDIARDSINNPFVKFKPEKRDFFRDANEYYGTLLPIVYTRNIIEPEYGLSFLHSGASSSTGFFFVQDKQTEVIMPDTFSSEEVELDKESTSAAFRYQSYESKNTFGFLSTYRGGEDGYHNAVAGVDGLFNLGVDDKVRFQVLYSDTEYPQSFAEDLCDDDGCTETPQPSPCLLGDCGTNAQVLRTDYDDKLNGHALRLSYRHNGPKALAWVNYFDVAPDFRADLGFARKVDIRVLNVAYGRNWYLKALDDDDGKSRIRLYVIGNHHRTHESDDEIETGITGLAEFRGSHQTVLRVAYRHRDIAVNRIDQSTLATGSNAPLFTEDYVFWYYQIAPNVRWRLDLDGRIGRVTDADNLVLGDITELKPKANYRLGDFEFAVEGVFRDFKVDGDHLYKETFMTYSAEYRPNKTISHRLLVLDDLTRQYIDNPAWLDKSKDRKEVDRSVEYTYTYRKDKRWKLLLGFKMEFEQENDSELDLTNREVYFKVERLFEIKI